METTMMNTDTMIDPVAQVTTNPVDIQTTGSNQFIKGMAAGALVATSGFLVYSGVKKVLAIRKVLKEIENADMDDFDDVDDEEDNTQPAKR